MKKRKPNPKRRPATQMDVRKAKEDARDEAITLAIVLFFTVLLDKHGATTEDLQLLWGEINNLSDSVKKRYVSVWDLKKTLEEEYEVHLEA